MGFFCPHCRKKVRGEPRNHTCTREKYKYATNRRFFNKQRRSANRGHGKARSSYVCQQFRDQGHCEYDSCREVHIYPSEDCPDGMECPDFFLCPKRHVIQTPDPPTFGHTESFDYDRSWISSQRKCFRQQSTSLMSQHRCFRHHTASKMAVCLQYILLGKEVAGEDQQEIICRPTSDSAERKFVYWYWKPCIPQEVSCMGEIRNVPYHHEHDEIQPSHRTGYCYWKPSPLCREYILTGKCRNFETSCTLRHANVITTHYNSASGIASPYVENETATFLSSFMVFVMWIVLHPVHAHNI